MVLSSGRIVADLASKLGLPEKSFIGDVVF
jgi:hypothetical protein